MAILLNFVCELPSLYAVLWLVWSVAFFCFAGFFCLVVVIFHKFRLRPVANRSRRILFPYNTWMHPQPAVVFPDTDH